MARPLPCAFIRGCAMRRADQNISPGASEQNMKAARDAGLRYVADTDPGISRNRSGSGFTYVDKNGKSIRDEETLARIRALVIPPAWTNVWICPDPRGHIQATGRDARGRKQ